MAKLTCMKFICFWSIIPKLFQICQLSCLVVSFNTMFFFSICSVAMETNLKHPKLLNLLFQENNIDFNYVKVSLISVLSVRLSDLRSLTFGLFLEIPVHVIIDNAIKISTWTILWKFCEFKEHNLKSFIFENLKKNVLLLFFSGCDVCWCVGRCLCLKCF